MELRVDLLVEGALGDPDQERAVLRGKFHLLDSCRDEGQHLQLGKDVPEVLRYVLLGEVVEATADDLSDEHGLHDEGVAMRLETVFASQLA